MDVVQIDCPGDWEYKNCVGYSAEIVKNRTRNLLLGIRRSDVRQCTTTAMDTTSVHGTFFSDMTPEHFPYYAGHYRGVNLRCLREYEVGIRSDARVGHTAATVPAEMKEFSSRLQSALSTVDHILSLNGSLGEVEKLVHYTQVAAAFFVEFLEIHPYANGNGHMARFIVLSLLARIRVYPTRKWNVDPRPADPPYTNLIKRYRDGDRDPLVRFILDAL